MKQDDEVIRQAFDLWYAIRHPKPVHDHPTWAHARKCDDYEVWRAASGAYLRRIAELEAKLDAALAPKPVAYPELVTHSSTPWYPDDSGEWVEVPEDLAEMPAELSSETMIEGLTRYEREEQVYIRSKAKTRYWVWNAFPHFDDRIVAYKVVKP